MFARIAHYYTADPSPYWELEQGQRFRGRAREVLRQMDGYEGSYFFMDRKSGKAISITLWEIEEAMNRSEEVARTIRKEIAGGLANIVDVGHYEVGSMNVQEIHERERVEQELQVARDIQQASLPKSVPAPEGWQITPFYQPAREVGGDFYDFHLLPEARLGLVVGDATGKGVPAALVMSTTCGMLQLAAEALDSSSPGEVLRQVNETLVARIPPAMFVTCFYAILEPESGTLSYANAGHTLPCYKRNNEDQADELTARGMPLGLMPSMPYEEKETTLVPGDVVFFCSDGLVEAHNPQGEMFGTSRLQGILSESYGVGRGLSITLMEELEHFTGEGGEQEDDITLLTLERSATRS